MKKIFAVLAVLLIGGCASLLEEPVCFPKNTAPKVSRAELTAVIGFADGSSAITPQNKEILQKVAQKAVSENAKIVVYGHASHRTISKNILHRILVNLRISNERAIHTAQILAAEGVDISDISTLALFDSRPIMVETTRAAEAANRRAEIYLYWLE